MTMRQFPDGRNNPHLWLLAFSGGVIALRFCAQLPSPGLCVAALLGLILLAVPLAWLRPLAAFAAGLCWALVVATAVLAATIPAEMEKRDVVITGRVTGVPAAGGGYQRFEFDVEQLEWRGESHPSPGKIRLKLYREQPQIRSGEKWRFTARLKRARGYQNPGARFDYETHLFHHRIRATGYVRERPPPVLLEPQPAYSVTAFRERMAGFIRAALPSGDEAAQAGILTALTVGIRSDMTAQNWEILARTGTIHLVAISGLHIGLVSGLVGLLGGWCWRFAGRLPLWLPAPKAGVMAGLLAGLVYALLAGMTIPTRRAVCMLAVVALALFLQRRPFGGETLVMALAVVLAVDPLAPLAVGFWLSFGAVLILVLSVVRARAYFSAAPSSPGIHPGGATPGQRIVRKIVRQLGTWSAIQIVLLIGMAPLLLVWFHWVSLSAPLANLIAVPAIGMLAVPAALLGLTLYAVGLEPAAELAFRGALWVLDNLWILLEWLAAPRWSVWQQPSPPAWTLPLAAVGVLLLLAPRVIPARHTGLLWMLPLFFAAPVARDEIAPGEFRYIMLEVGHGLASVVQTRDHLLVYDAGPRFKGGFDTGETVVAPFLRQLDAKKIDALVISHGDNDHSGGHRALLAQFETGRILTSAPALIPAAHKCRAGQGWTWNQVRFEMLAPPPGDIRDGNEASCVLKVHSAFGALLLTGDIGEPSETMLVDSVLDLSADVLQVPHHGSITSSTGAFLDRVRPRVALASIGYLNRYGHPHATVSERYANRRIPVYRSADEGAITVSFSAHGIGVQGHRGSQRKYWLQKPKQLGSGIRLPRSAPRRNHELAGPAPLR